MVTQQIFLPMVPDSAPIVVNLSQYDFDAAGYAGRLFFNLINNGAAYDMDGATAVFQGEKPDGKVFAYPATVVNASVVRVNVRQQMTNVSGRVVCQLVLSNTDGQIGSFNIWLEVQPSSATGGDPSETDIPALIAQAKTYVDEAEQAAQDAQSWSANPPYIGANGNWFVYDTGTSAYVDSGVYASGTEGSVWYTGTAVYGKDPNPTIFATGIALSRVGDMYLNKNEGAIYHCTLGGIDTVAKWAYDMTLTGGGGGTFDYGDLNNKPQINGVTLANNKTTGDLIPLGTGLDFDPITLKLSVDMLLGSLSNVDTTTPSNNDLLGYDNGQWENMAAPSLAYTGTASKTTTRKQQLTFNSTSYDVDGSMYMVAANESALSYTFTNADILTTSTIDVYTDTWGDNPSNVEVPSDGTCTVTFAQAKTRSVKIYIK